MWPSKHRKQIAIRDKIPKLTFVNTRVFRSCGGSCMAWVVATKKDKKRANSNTSTIPPSYPRWLLLIFHNKRLTCPPIWALLWRDGIYIHCDTGGFRTIAPCWMTSTRSGIRAALDWLVPTGHRDPHTSSIAFSAFDLESGLFDGLAALGAKWHPAHERI
jgi:hypothetical protein